MYSDRNVVHMISYCVPGFQSSCAVVIFRVCYRSWSFRDSSVHA